MEDAIRNKNIGVHWVDFLVVGTVLCISVGVGIYQALSGGKQRTTDEFLVGNRRMKVIPVALSLMVTSESSIMMLGNPAESYLYGLQIMLITLGGTIAAIMVVRLYVPVIHRLQITSINEYYMKRFRSVFLKKLCVVLSILTTMWYMGIVLYGSATAIETAIGVEMWKSIVIVAASAVIYTTFKVITVFRNYILEQGGFKAVIWTDVFQCVVMFAGIFAILIKGTMDTGGVGEVFRRAEAGGRLKLFDFRLSPFVRQSFWTIVIGTVLRFNFIGCNQATVQRINSTPTLSDAKKVIWVMIPPFVIVNGLAILEGTVAYAYYHKKGCDPLESGRIKNANQIIPYLIMELYKDYPGFVGLFYASLLSAALSSLSSGLSGISAIFWEDIAKPLTGEISQSRATLIAKISVAITGILSVAVSFFAAEIGGTLMQVTATVLSTFTGPIIGIFMVGMLCPWANARSTIFGALVGFSIVTWYAMGKSFAKLPSVRYGEALIPGFTYNCSVYNDTLVNTTYITPVIPDNTTCTIEDKASIPRELSGLETFYSISYHYSAPIGIVITLIMTNIFSLFCGYIKRTNSDYRYVSSLADAFLCCLPDRCLRSLNCGYKRTSLNSDGNNANETTQYDAPICSTVEKVDMSSVPNGLSTTHERVIDEQDRPPTFTARFDTTKETALLD